MIDRRLRVVVIEVPRGMWGVGLLTTLGDILVTMSVMSMGKTLVIKDLGDITHRINNPI